MNRIWVAFIAGFGLASASPLPAHAGMPFMVPIDGGRAFSGPAVVVLWGTWCVSCAAELKRLPALSDAAAPLPVITLAIDPPERARRALEESGIDTGLAFADPGAPADVLARWGGTSLPLAVAIDAKGRVCGRKSGLLGTDQLRKWATACSR